MSDMRSKQPARQDVDLFALHGGARYVAVIETWTYSSIKNEDVFTRELTVRYGASDFARATAIAQSLAQIIALAHDVWQCNVRLVAAERFHKEGK